MSRTIRSPRPWADDRTAPTRDGYAARTPADAWAMRQQNRNRRHRDAAQLRKLPRDIAAARDMVWHASQRRDAHALPSW